MTERLPNDRRFSAKPPDKGLRDAEGEKTSAVDPKLVRADLADGLVEDAL